MQIKFYYTSKIKKIKLNNIHSLITLHIFRSSSVISSPSARGQRCINAHPLEFTSSVGDSVGNFRPPTNAYGLFLSVSMSVMHFQ